MEFDEMKKIWDAQNGQTLYAIDEEALHKRVLKKKDKSARLANMSELMLIGSLIFSTGIIMSAAIYKSKFDLLPMGMALMMAIVAVMIYMRRRKRLSWQNNFENSILGDMNQAVANANYQVKLSQSVKWLYLAVAILSVVGVVDAAEEWWKGALVAAFFIIVMYAARWEYRTFYVSQKKGLEKMRDKLTALQNEEAAPSDMDGQL